MKNPVKNIFLKIRKINKKKMIITISLLVVISSIVLVVVFSKRKNKKVVKSDFSFTRTITLEYSKLQDTVVSSGVIESQSTSSITSSVNNAIVSKINYSVGDYVEKDDVIIELDTTNLNNQISKIEESLQEKYDNAVSAKDEAWGTYNAAKQVYDSINSEYTSAYNAIANYQNDYDTKESARKILAEACYSQTTCDLNTYPGYIEANDSADIAKASLNDAKTNLNYDELEKKYNSAKEAYIKAENSLSQANANVANADENLNSKTNNDELDELYDAVSNYKLKAKTTGQITSINAVLGSNANGTLATIQDTGKLKIALTIDEYDILKLSLGMKAIIDTDASNKTYEGEVSQISPVASSSMDSSGFKIEVSVTSEDVSDLLIGMNAEVTIIIEELSENFNVPLDAVEVKQDGTKVIYIQNENNDYEELIVTTGETNGYYIEVFSDSLKEGMIVRASANADEAEINSFNDDEIDTNQGFDFGGFGGGGMPSGNRIPSGADRSNGGFGDRRGGFN